MTMTVQAVYSAGVLRPTQLLPIAEGETVELTIEPALDTTAPEREIIRRIKECKTYRDWLTIAQELPPDDGGYDIVKSLDENRRLSGEWPLNSGEGDQP